MCECYVGTRKTNKQTLTCNRRTIFLWNNEASLPNRCPFCSNSLSLFHNKLLIVVACFHDEFLMATTIKLKAPNHLLV